MKSLWRYFIYAFAVMSHYSGVDSLVRRLRRPALSILMLHRLRTDADPLPLSLSPSTYRWMVSLLRKRGWLQSLDTGLQGLDERNRQLSYAITLDDGYADNLVVLESDYSGAPLTIYVSTALVGGETFWAYQLVDALDSTEKTALDLTDLGYGNWPLNNEDQKRACLEYLNANLKTLHIDGLESNVATIVARLGVDHIQRNDRMLTWEEIERLVAGGVDIGSHTQRHGILSRLEPDEVRSEVVDSGEILKGKLGLESLHFSYPNGGHEDFNEDIKNVVRQAGYKSAVTTIEGVNGPGADRFALARINITEDRCRAPNGKLSEAYFLCYTSGLIANLRELFGR